jgi:hypothetical protein
VRPQGAGGIIQFDEVFKYVYSPNVKEFLVEAENVTLHTLPHGALINIFKVASLRPIQAFQYVFSPDVKIFLAARTGFMGDSFCEENDSGSPTFAPFRTKRPALDAMYDKCARESERLFPANAFDILLTTECSRSKAGMV